MVISNHVRDATAYLNESFGLKGVSVSADASQIVFNYPGFQRNRVPLAEIDDFAIGVHIGSFLYAQTNPGVLLMASDYRTQVQQRNSSHPAVAAAILERAVAYLSGFALHLREEGEHNTDFAVIGHEVHCLRNTYPTLYTTMGAHRLQALRIASALIDDTSSLADLSDLTLDQAATYIKMSTGITLTGK